jgi:DNA-binding NarL/FixJ family response regulator
MKILIVEDNALVALDLEQQVTDAGHSIVGIADTSSKAIDLAAEHGADLVLMDVSLGGWVMRYRHGPSIEGTFRYSQHLRNRDTPQQAGSALGRHWTPVQALQRGGDRCNDTRRRGDAAG